LREEIMNIKNELDEILAAKNKIDAQCDKLQSKYETQVSIIEELQLALKGKDSDKQLLLTKSTLLEQSLAKIQVGLLASSICNVN